MRKVFFISAIIILFGTVLFGEENFANVIENLVLKTPPKIDDCNYLGLNQSIDHFSLKDIHTDIVIIEIFNMYCPHCQRYAPTGDKLYEMIEADSKTHGRVKLIGIGVGNSPYEVEIFKTKFTVPFPLFDDQSSAILDKLAGIRTPTFFAVKKTGEKVEVFFKEQGAHDDPEAFLKRVIEQSKVL